MALNKNSLFDGNDRDKVGRNLIFGEDFEDDGIEHIDYCPANDFTELMSQTKSKHTNSELNLSKSSQNNKM